MTPMHQADFVQERGQFDEYHCSLCGWRALFRMRDGPFQTVTLDAGNESAKHSGGRGGLTIEQTVIEQDRSDDDQPSP